MSATNGETAPDTKAPSRAKKAPVTKRDLSEEVSRALEIPLKEAGVIVESIFNKIVKALQTGDRVELRGFGSFRTRQRAARVGRNPKTGASVNVPAKRIPFFKPSKDVNDLIANLQETSDGSRNLR